MAARKSGNGEMPIDVLRDIRGEIRNLRTEMRGDLQEVRGEIHGLRAEVRDGLEKVNARLDTIPGFLASS